MNLKKTPTKNTIELLVNQATYIFPLLVGAANSSVLGRHRGLLLTLFNSRINHSFDSFVAFFSHFKSHITLYVLRLVESVCINCLRWKILMIVFTPQTYTLHIHFDIYINTKNSHIYIEEMCLYRFILSSVSLLIEFMVVECSIGVWICSISDCHWFIGCHIDYIHIEVIRFIKMLWMAQTLFFIGIGQFIIIFFNSMWLIGCCTVQSAP